jgi:hypothetical protein
MTGSSPKPPPGRVTDLVTLKRQGAEVVCRTAFEIQPVDFQHRANPFRAHIFLCRYAGTIDGHDYLFRKCYARGCPNNLCPHVSQAVRIANRYLRRDYHTLRAAGIEVEERLFDLADMMVAFDQAPAPGVDIWTMPDLAAAARDGRRVSVDAALSFISAVEHFDHRDQPQTYLIGEFDATVNDAPCRCERCFACYPTEGGEPARRRAVEIADARLALLYEEFQQAGIQGPHRYFRECT